MHMTVELAVATVMVLLTVAVHGLGLMGLARMLGAHEARRGAQRFSPVSIDGVVVAVGLVLGLFLLHGVEIWAYAVLFKLIGAVSDLREAVYFSTISYGAIGYGDGDIRSDWKLLGAIEGINGAILLGWSVAFFVTVMGRMLPGRRKG